MAQRRGQRRTLDFPTQFHSIVDNVAEAVRGKREAIEVATECLVAGGHLLVEDVPGVGKTLLAKALAASIDATWARIQFTPDLLPSDVSGTTVWQRATDEMRWVPGPIFRNLVLADEINRASPRTQAALLEAMEEHQVTADGVTHQLPDPHLVIATQNPIEFEGTFPLPEGQLDRFTARVSLGYPDGETELDIIERHLDDSVLPHLEPAATVDDVLDLRDASREIHLAPALREYVVDLAGASRRDPQLALGISPRGTIAVLRLARVRAAAAGRDYVVPDDLQPLLEPTLAHRLVVSAEADLAGVTPAAALAEVIASVPVPTARRARASR